MTGSTRSYQVEDLHSCETCEVWLGGCFVDIILATAGGKESRLLKELAAARFGGGGSVGVMAMTSCRR